MYLTQVYVLNSSLKTKVDYIIAGDYNIYFLKHTSHDTTHEGTSSFVNNLSTHSMLPVIIQPIRFSAESSTLIDIIFINKPNESFKSGILLCDITDHLPIFYISHDLY